MGKTHTIHTRSLVFCPRSEGASYTPRSSAARRVPGPQGSLMLRSPSTARHPPLLFEFLLKILPNSKSSLTLLISQSSLTLTKSVHGKPFAVQGLDGGQGVDSPGLDTNVRVGRTIHYPVWPRVRRLRRSGPPESGCRRPQRPSMTVTDQLRCMSPSDAVPMSVMMA